jgi:hypothetical protein
MSNRLPKIVAMMCLWLCGLAAAGSAQVSISTGAIQGHITDPASAVVPGATVTLTNPALAVNRQTKSLTDGAFIFPLLQPASGYWVEVEAAGFQRLVIEDLTVRVTEVTIANARIAVGAVMGTVVVKGDETQPVQTTSPTLGGTLGPEVVAALPLNTRNPLQLLATDAGVASIHGSTTFFVAGQRSTFNNYVLNGVDANNFEFGSLGTVPTPNPDSVREFRVQTSLYDATQGRGGGGNIALVTRSGSQKIHGNVYEFHRDSALAANNFFLNRNHVEKPFLLRNHFGASLGGPFPGKRSFWFLNYEGSRQRNVSSISGFLHVLPAKRDAESLAAAFNLPAPAIDPVAVNMLNLPGPYDGMLVPSGRGTVGRLGTFAFATTSRFDADQGTARLDHGMKLWGDPNYVTANLFLSRSDSFSPIGGSSGLGTGSAFATTNRSYSIRDTHTFSPNLINEFTAGATINIIDGNNGVNAPKLADIGMSRFNQSIFPEIPSFGFSDQLGGFGQATNPGPRQHTPSVTLRDMVSYIKGRHSLRFGIETRHYQFNYAQAFLARGSLFFGTQFAPALYPQPAGAPNLSFRDFLIGAPASISIASGTDDRGFRASDFVGFIQDDFRVTRRLTLNLGLRYDFLGNISEKRARLGNFDLDLVPPEARLTGGAGLLKGFISPASLPGFGTPGVKDTTLEGEDKNNFAPRLGFALDVLGNSKLAVRGGYGIYYIRLSAIPALQLTSQPPFFQQISQSGLGVGSLKNPFPALPLPSEFPLLPVAPRLTGLNPTTFAPIFDRPTALSVVAFERNLRTPYSQQWNLTVQYEFLPRWTVELGYLGTHSIKLYNTQSINNAFLRNANNPGPFGLATNSFANRDARVPIVGFSAFGLTVITESAKSFYNALLVTVNHQFARGLYFKGAYTFSKSLDNNSAGSDFDIGGLSGFQLAPDLNKGLSDHDVRHRLALTYVYDLPGPRRGWLQPLLGAWAISGATTFQSGFPGSVTQFAGSSLSGSSGRANLIPNCQLLTSGSVKSRLDNYLNIACAESTPLLTGGMTFGPLSPQEGPGDQFYTITPGGNGRLQGTSGRGVFRGPFQQRWDFALAKKIPAPRLLGEAGRIEFRSEFFNLFNKTNFGTPSGFTNPATFGRITGAFGAARQIQFALKIYF